MYLILILTGLGPGAVYAAIAVAVVVTYRGTGVINFAAGAMGMWTAFVFNELVQNGTLTLPLVIIPASYHIGHVPFAAALVIAMLEAVVLGLIAHFLIFRPLRSRPILAKVVASVGFMLALQALVVLRFGTNQRVPVPILPNNNISLLGQTIGAEYIWTAVVVVAVSVGLWAYFRFTRLGMATRAAAENEPFVVLAGISPDLLAGLTWVAASFAAGLLLTVGSPIVQLNPELFITATVPALAAALIARMSSIGIAAGAGLALGAIESVIGFVSTTQSWWPSWAQVGVANVVPFLAVVVVLFVAGRSIPDRGAGLTDPLPAVPMPRTRPVVVVPVFIAGLALMLLTHGGYRYGVITGMIISIAALSLVVLTGLVGQISLMQAGLAGAGGFVLSGLANSLHIPFPFSTILAALAATAFGVIAGLPALRIRGAQLAVVTLAAALALEQFVFNNPSFSSAAGASIPSPSIFGWNLAVQHGNNTATWQFGLLIMVVLTICALAVANLIRSDTGRRFLAVRSNERASAAVGISVTYTKLAAFAVASFLAGLCGSFIGYSRGQISADSFSSTTGITFLVFAYLGGITSVSGAMVAGTLAPLGLGFVVADRLLNLGNEYTLISAVGLILTAIFNPEGISAGLARQMEFVRARLGGSGAPKLVPAVEGDLVGATVAPSGLPPSLAVTGELALETRALSVRYGGVIAADNVSLQVKAGQIVGLIGPNGAGKTSIVDAITGFTAAGGAVLLSGVDVSRDPPHERARRGLARTWQSVELFRDLSVRENLSVCTSRSGVWPVLRDVARPLNRMDPQTTWALDLFGLTGLLDRHPQELSLGQQKLVGVARALAARPHVVMLDEPAAGLDTTETIALGRYIRAIASTGTGVLLIDHDMGLVLDVCDHVYVLEFGQLIANDRPEIVRDDPRVVSAYLGEKPPKSEAVTASRSDKP